MSNPDTSPARRPPRFTKAAWCVLVGGLGLTYLVVWWCEANRRPGDLLPGLAQAVIGILVTALGCSVFGLIAVVRREQNSWLAWLPLLAGLLTIAYFTSNYVRHS
jgi:hypothetical protein